MGGFEDNKDVFLEEARDFLAKIEAALLGLEERSGDTELINEIFRGLHTIKGSGAMFGFDKVSAFAHKLENLFDEIRKGSLGVDPDTIEVGLRSVDCLSRLLDDSEDPREIAELSEDITALREGRSVASSAAKASKSKAFPEAASDGKAAAAALPQAWRILFRPQAQLFQRGVRVELLLGELRSLGACSVEAITDRVPDLESMGPSSCYLSWRILLSTEASLESIRSVFVFVEDYSEIGIEAIELAEENGRPLLPKIGEILVRDGHLDEGSVEEIRKTQKAFGEVAVETGKVGQEAVNSALAEQAIIRTTHVEREARQEAATVRVRREKLDALVDLVGELVILQAILGQEARKSGLSVFSGISENLARLSSDLRDSIMSIRMVPLAELFSTFQRLVRDLSRQIGKDIVLSVSGADTELDKNVIELLKDPLVHIIRNAADHGIESGEERLKSGKNATGTISLDARQVGHRVEISITDDGRGLDIEAIRKRAIQKKLIDASETDQERIMALIFEPGFSTAEAVTDLSGRGVGMDVVKRNLERLRGDVRLKSEAGKGLNVILSIPLTLVIVEGLLVRVGEVDYVIALSQVDECIDLQGGIQSHNDLGIIRLRGKTIPVIDLAESLMRNPSLRQSEESRLVIVTVEGEEVALKVDMIVGKQQVVIKPFTASLKGIAAVSGATILGDGSVALILNVAELVKSSVAVTKSA